MGLFDRNKHQHTWEETGRKFYPPRYVVEEARGKLSYDHKKLIFGYTTITYKCQGCGVVKTGHIIGEVP